MADMTSTQANQACRRFRELAEAWSRENEGDGTPPQERLRQEHLHRNAIIAQQLAHEIAYESARTDIECICACVGEVLEDHPRYWDTSIAIEEDGDDRIFVDRAVLYLDLVGLLDRHPDNPAHVHIRVRDEGAAP